MPPVKPNITMPIEKKKLLTQLRDALQHMRYTSVTTGFERTLAPHQLNAIMDTIKPIVDKFFEENLVQGQIWRD